MVRQILQGVETTLFIDDKNREDLMTNIMQYSFMKQRN